MSVSACTCNCCRKHNEQLAFVPWGRKELHEDDGLGVHNLRSKLFRASEEQTEKILLEQLGNLVNDGLLEVEQTMPVIVDNVDERTGDHVFTMQRAVRLRLKAHERMAQLMTENAALRKVVQAANKMATYNAGPLHSVRCDALDTNACECGVRDFHMAMAELKPEWRT